LANSIDPVLVGQYPSYVTCPVTVEVLVIEAGSIGAARNLTMLALTVLVDVNAAGVTAAILVTVEVTSEVAWRDAGATRRRILTAPATVDVDEIAAGTIARVLPPEVIFVTEPEIVLVALNAAGVTAFRA
jgi:hypothetical protein